jgi:hypothetical protein
MNTEVSVIPETLFCNTVHCNTFLKLRSSPDLHKAHLSLDSPSNEQNT